VTASEFKNFSLSSGIIAFSSLSLATTWLGRLREFLMYEVKMKQCNRWDGGGATRPLPTDGGVEELYGQCRRSWDVTVASPRKDFVI